MLMLAVIALSTNTAQLGVPVLATGNQLALVDLERSATDLYLLTPKEAGIEVLPLAVGKIPVKIYLKDHAQPVELPLLVTEPPLEEQADVADIKPPVAARPALWPWVLGAALIALGYWVFSRKKTKLIADQAPAPPDPRSAGEIALESLTALEQSKLWAEGDFKNFYARMTDVIRAYLEARYGMPALKLTTWELVKHMRQLEADRKAIGLLKELFDRADLVKFAKTTPQNDQGSRDLAIARSLIELTSPIDLAAAPSRE